LYKNLKTLLHIPRLYNLNDSLVPELFRHYELTAKTIRAKQCQQHFEIWYSIQSEIKNVSWKFSRQGENIT